MEETINQATEERCGLLGKLLEIQQKLKVEKGQFNDFGGYSYRSKEDILEAVKPLAHERNCIVVVDDNIRQLENGWVYCESTATLIDCGTGKSIAANGAAREAESKTKMDVSQITGVASSYAGKRALGNLFAIDDTADADATYQEQPNPAPTDRPFDAKCRHCGTVVGPFQPGTDPNAYQCPTCGMSDFEVK